MALNKYMHPRNIYKTPPDFGVLVKLCPDFYKVAKTNVTGKITIDFKNPHSLRILTKSLLKCDFNLDVDIPEDRLVPTLPLRLNYILWIEDLLMSIERDNNIMGLDIGTGACAIYPLLAAVKNKWHMFGTEQDEESLLKAEENVKKNNLGEFIQIKKNTSKSIIEHLLSDESSPKFDFCMCNPPFYSSVQELCESRSPARPPPKNGFTGSPQELITEGGELLFCRKLIAESKSYKEKVILFTTMVGHKYNLTELIHDLKAGGIKHTHTEFCQGRVTRWGLAWSYHSFDIYKLVSPREKPRRKKESLVYMLPHLQDSVTSLETAFDKLKKILKDLEITHKVIQKRGNSLCIDIISRKNTWSNQRLKRRLLKRLEADNTKKSKTEKADEINIENPINGFPSEGNISVALDIGSTSISIENQINTDEYEESVPLVHALLKLLKKETNVLLEIEFLGGSTGKEGLHQIIQYIKNNWK